MRKNQQPVRVTAAVKIRDRVYDLEELTPGQRAFVGTHIGLNLLNGAYIGKAEFSAPDLPSVQEVFPDVFAAK